MRADYASSAAFGLLEALVVIGLLAVLLMLGLPVFSMAQEQGKRNSCVANLRQISAAVRLYAIDHQGTYPPNRGNKAYHDEKNPSGVYHQDQLRSYLPTYTYNGTPDHRTAAPFWCPADLLRKNQSPQQSYGINRYRGGGDDTGVNRKLAAEPYPAKCLYLVDATRENLSTSLIDPNSWPLGSSALEPVPVGPVRLDFRHGGKANVLFVDGHVEAFTPAELHGKDVFRINR